MFTNTVSQTSLTTLDADEFYGNKVVGDSWNGDTTLISTLRAIVCPRMKDSDSIRVRNVVANYNAQSYKDYLSCRNTGILSRSLGANVGATRQFLVVNVRGDDDTVTAGLEYFKTVLPEYAGKYVEISEVYHLFKKSFKSLCMVNESLKTTVLFVGELNLKRFHFVQCALLGMLPWYFKAEDGISDDELKVIYALREPNSDAYIQAIDNIASKFDMRTSRIKKLLEGWEANELKNQLERYKSLLTSIMNNIRDLEETIAGYNRQYYETNIKIFGTEKAIEEAGNESVLMDYVIANKRVQLEDVTNTRLAFSVYDYLQFWDEDVVQNFLNNRRSFVYTQFSETGDVTRDDIYRIVKAIFIDQTLKLKVCASYRIELNDSVYGQGYHAFDGNSFPNPHINRYECLGNYKSQMNKAIRDGDTIMAIELCLASCRSLNWSDSVVMEEFFRTAANNSTASNVGKCLETEDGKVLTFKEAAVLLRPTETTEE